MSFTHESLLKAAVMVSLIVEGLSFSNSATSQKLAANEQAGLDATPEYVEIVFLSHDEPSHDESGHPVIYSDGTL